MTEEAGQSQWDGTVYTGEVCTNCSRERVMLCRNDHRVCEKCKWDQEGCDYAPCEEDQP